MSRTASIPDQSERLLADGDTAGCAVSGLCVLGHAIALHSTIPRVTAMVESAYAEFLDPNAAASGGPMYIVRRARGGDICVADPGYRSTVCGDPEQAFYFWSGQLGGHRLFRGRHLLLHGAALCGPGGAFVFPGPSHGGKTTLALRLAAAGFVLLSDEFVPLDIEAGRVVPFRRALFVRRATLTALGAAAPDTAACLSMYDPACGRGADPSQHRVLLPAAALSAPPARVPSVARIAFLAGFDAGSTQVARLPAAEAMQRMMACAVNGSYLAPVRRREAIASLGRLLGAVPSAEVRLGPLDEAVEHLAAALTAPLAVPDDSERRVLNDVVAASLSRLPAPARIPAEP